MRGTDMSKVYIVGRPLKAGGEEYWPGDEIDPELIAYLDAHLSSGHIYLVTEEKDVDRLPPELQELAAKPVKKARTRIKREEKAAAEAALAAAQAAEEEAQLLADIEAEADARAEEELLQALIDADDAAIAESEEATEETGTDAEPEEVTPDADSEPEAEPED
jgi:phage protein D